MSFALRMQAVNNKLINKFGGERTVAIQLQRQTKAWDPVETEYVFTTTTIDGLVGVSIGFDNTTIGNTAIQAGDVLVALTTDVEPLITDKVIMDGFTWSIVDTPRVVFAGGDKPVSYKMQLRK